MKGLERAKTFQESNKASAKIVNKPKLGPVAIVENNERQSQHTPDKMIEQASQLLSFDKEFYNVKKELFSVSHF